MLGMNIFMKKKVLTCKRDEMSKLAIDSVERNTFKSATESSFKKEGQFKCCDFK